jgi:UDP-N-acetylglucosamine diphosphorylase / glucose-1-phosphate thymidylyltransferase / UDP-N-acetylgalactosamine diphosphorylase / glucosamine-1-phosphate N-acetyltransferase / galactosamine-1-phosphate N-acetyltransferase
MIKLVLEQEKNDNLFPLTLTRSAADIRLGILTLREKWICLVQGLTVADDGLTPQNEEEPGDIHLDAATIPDAALLTLPEANSKLQTTAARKITYPWEIFQLNDAELRKDFELITRSRRSAPVPDTVSVKGSAIFIESGAKLSHCIINTETGPVYIGADTEIMEGSLIRGPFALCRGSVIKMGAKIYGATTIGPGCVVGGEIKNSVIFGYSNKSHDGYLGDSVIGEWCNFGAGTSTSNMKNNAGDLKMWDIHRGEYWSPGLRKCGLIMGDYSRAAINTSFNTGSIVGVCANVFGGGLMPKFIPSFSWGNQRYQFEKALADIGNWKKLKQSSLSEKEKTGLKLIFEQI